MEAAFNVTGERRKALVEAVKAFIDAPAVYQNAPSFAYVIGDYTVSKTGTVSGPVSYTHLDVYKRQVIRQFGENTRAVYAKVLISMEETRSGFTPVSYTHLDVYKRQM